jgi:hypothetical protein
MAVAALIRLPALWADFWFDEILSYERYAARAQSVVDVFFSPALKHDNNHHLNTVVLYLLGDQRHWVLYRLPGALAGIVAVGAVVLIGQRQSRRTGLMAGALVASSYLIAVYSTEARGYPWLLCLAAGGFLALDRFLATRRLAAAALFWLAIAGGLAAHPTILHFYLGAVVWSGYRLRSSGMDWLRLHAPVACWTILWILVVLRGSVVGGGPAWSWSVIVDQGLAWTFGYPVSTVPALIAGLAAALLVIIDARWLWSAGSDEGLFYAGAVLGPIIFVASLSPPYLFPRYFLVPLFFLLVVAGRQLARLSRTPVVGSSLAMALVLPFLTGNGLLLASVVRERHGVLSAAVDTLTARTAVSPAVVTSRSLDQWTELPLRFYARRMGVDDRIVYVTRGEIADGRADPANVLWSIEPSPPCGLPPAADLSLPQGHVLHLVRSFHVCGPSGMSWALYGRVP